MRNRLQFAEIHDLRHVHPELENAEPATIFVRPVSPQNSVWAFVTSTNNVTQQVDNFLPVGVSRCTAGGNY